MVVALQVPTHLARYAVGQSLHEVSKFTIRDRFDPLLPCADDGDEVVALVMVVQPERLQYMESGSNRRQSRKGKVTY